MNKYMCMLLCMWMFIGCSSEKDILPKPVTFTATTEDASRIVINGTAVNWLKGDQIRVVAQAPGSSTPCVNGYFESISGGSSSTTFVHKSGDKLDGTYINYVAAYPAQETLMDGDGMGYPLSPRIDYVLMGIAIPNRQQYVAGSVDSHAFPMFAHGPSTNLSFINLSALLCFKVASTVDFVLDSLAISSYIDPYDEDQGFNENFVTKDSSWIEYDFLTDKFQTSGFTHYITVQKLLNIGETLTLTPKNFYMGITPTRYSSDPYPYEQKYRISGIRLWGHKSDGTPVKKTFYSSMSAFSVIRSTIIDCSLTVNGYDS